MAEFIYPYASLGTLISLVIWFWRVLKGRSTLLANIFFWGCILLYIGTVFFSQGTFVYKLLWVLPRDIVIFIAVALISNNLKNAKGFWLLALISGGIIYFFYFNTLATTFTTTDAKEEVDASAELLFDIKNPQQLAQLKKQLAAYDLTIEKAFPDLQHPEYSNLEEYYAVDIPEKNEDDLEEILEALQASGLVDWVERNEIVALGPIEEGVAPQRDTNYGLNDPGLGKLWTFKKMQMDRFYPHIKKLKPRKKATVAILDTGVDAQHEDLKGNYTSTNTRYDRDAQGHGTHCAGVAGAVANNKKGIAAFSPNNRFVQITSIKVLNDFGFGSQRSIIKGIITAADRKVDVISMSLGGRSDAKSKRAYEEAIRYANKAGAIVVVAAGNESTNATKVSPANCKGVITVAAVDEALQKAKFSNEVNDVAMGIAAGGVNIYATFPKNQYKALNGTSMATPAVAGLIGLLKALKPSLTTKEAYEILKTTGVDTQSTSQTGKFIQPLAAVKRLQSKRLLR